MIDTELDKKFKKLKNFIIKNLCNPDLNKQDIHRFDMNVTGCTLYQMVEELKALRKEVEELKKK
jgi:hypothetical protein